MKKRKLLSSILSLLLATLILFYAIPATVFAEESYQFPEYSDAVPEDQLPANYGEAIKKPVEIVELRQEKSKVFRLENGTYTIAHYADAVHYKGEDGSWNDINNRLYSFLGKEYENTNTRIKFAHKTTGNGALLTLKDNGTKLTLSLVGASKGVYASVTNYEDNPEANAIDKLKNLENLTSRVVYKDILDGVDIEYFATSLSVKENIIVKEKQDNYTYRFTLKLSGLTPYISENGDVEIKDGEGNIFYVIPAPIVYDSSYTQMPKDKASYKLEGENGKYTLSVSADTEWMNSDERVYPVVIDPTVDGTEENAKNPSQPPEASGVPVSNSEFTVSDDGAIYWKSEDLINAVSDASVVSAVLSLPAVSASSNEDYAYKVSKVIGNSPDGIEIDSTVADYSYPDENGNYNWDITELVLFWQSNPELNYGLAIQPYYAVGSEIQPTENESTSLEYSVALANTAPVAQISYANQEGLESYWAYTSQSLDEGMTVHINNFTGKLTQVIPTLSTTDALMPYTVSLVNDSSGALEYCGELYYGATPYNKYLPTGFKLNISEIIYPSEYSATPDYFTYIDADGTEKTFYPSTESLTVYYDNHGEQIKLNVSDYDSFTMTDDTKVTKTYTKRSLTEDSVSDYYWYLTSVRDADGNELLFELDSLNRPTKVSMKPKNSTAIDFIDLYYNDTGLFAIYNKAAKQAVVLKYTESASDEPFLSRVEYLNLLVSDFSRDSFLTYISGSSPSLQAQVNVRKAFDMTYNAAGRLVTVTDVQTGYKLTYEWSAADTSGKVMSVTEISGTTPGQTILLNYGEGYSETVSSGSDDIINTADDISQRLIFDAEGRVKSVYAYSQDGVILGASNQTYQEQENVKNNIKTSSITGGLSPNYLINGNFDKSSSNTSLDYWTTSANVRPDGQRSFSGAGDYSARFYTAQNLPAYISQTVFLEAGEYTLSMEMETANTVNMYGTVSVTSVAGSGFAHSEEIPLNPVSLLGNKAIFSTSFEIASYTGGGDKVSVEIRFTLSGTRDNTFSIYVDNVMLARQQDSLDYNLVSFGGFDDNILTSSGAQNPMRSTYWESDDTVSITNDSLFGNVLRIPSSASGGYTVTQKVFEATSTELSLYDTQYGEYTSNATQYYKIYGFAKAPDAIIDESGGKHFRIGVNVGYYQGSGKSDEIVSHTFDFVEGCEGWQMVFADFETYKSEYKYRCVRYIEVFCEYSGQANGTALFDNISVISLDYPDYEQYYYYGFSGYHKNGLPAAYMSGIYNEYYDYNTDRNLTVTANDEGKITYHIYSTATGKSHQIEKTQQYNFTYDGGTRYPFAASNPFSAVQKDLKSETLYQYNEFGLATQTTSQVCYENGAVGNKIITNYQYETTAGSKIFGTLIAENNGVDRGVKYFYDANDGKLLATVNLYDGNGMSYTYDSFNRLVMVVPATAAVSSSPTSYNPQTDAESVCYEYDAAGRLSRIETESTAYTFSYDAFGNTSESKIGNESLATYEYNSYNGKLNTINYGNGFSEEYVYNSLEKLSQIWYNYDDGTRELAFSYEYNGAGLIHTLYNHVTGSMIIYKYDEDNRLLSANELGEGEMYYSFSVSHRYHEKKNRLSNIYYDILAWRGGTRKCQEFRFGFDYNPDGTVSKYHMVLPHLTGDIFYTYDGVGRVTEYTVEYEADSGNVFDYTVDYTYRRFGSSQTDMLVTGYTTSGDVENSYSYEYDERGNITKITDSEDREIRYTYDNLGQLVREDNELLGYTYTYAYDNAGNITSAKRYSLTAANVAPSGTATTESYGYTNSQWGDQLTSYNGTQITYDEIGNPLSYYNGSSYSFEWTGRSATSVSYGGVDYTFEYDDRGYRKRMAFGNFDIDYLYDGDLLIGEIIEKYVGSDLLHVYIYDDNGSPIGMGYRVSSYAEGVWDIFIFEKNLQGDITAVYDEEGTLLITYEYDAWGNHTIAYHNGASASSVVARNPFRYRGYYYDDELDLYWCGTRFYDSKTGRWINADLLSVVTVTPMALTDKNLYSYCDNNPVMRADYTGEFWNYIVGGIVGAITGTAISMANGEDLSGIIIGGASGAASGVVAASGLGLLSQAVISGGISGLADAANQTIDIFQRGGSIADYNILKTTTEALLGGVASAAGSLLGNAIDRSVTKFTQKAWSCFNSYYEKTLSANMMNEVGEATVGMIKEAGKALAKSNFYSNASKCVSSVVGSVLSLWNIAR